LAEQTAEALELELELELESDALKQVVAAAGLPFSA
jgi:hypothetical protein